MDTHRCIAVKQNGERCNHPKKNNTDYCGKHIKIFTKDSNINKTSNINKIKTTKAKVIDITSTDKFKYNTTRIKDLTATLEYYKISTIGNKKQLYERLVNLFGPLLEYNLQVDKLRKIQYIFRKYLKMKRYKLQGLLDYNIRNCVNTTDIITLDELTSIDKDYLFMYKDNNDNDFIYGFDIRSIKQLDSFENPYNRISFSDKLIKNIREAIRLLDIQKISTNVEPEIITDTKLLIKRRTVKIFQMMDNLDQYTNPSWFLDLSTKKLKLLYKELEDIWNYRLELKETDKRNIVPPDGILFTISVKNIYHIDNKVKLQTICLDIIEKLISSSTVRDNCISGCIYALLGFVIVNKDAAEALPGYTSMVTGQPEQSIYNVY